MSLPLTCKAHADAIQLANQFVASVYYVNKHHELKLLGANDKIREDKKDNEAAQREPDGTLPQIHLSICTVDILVQS